MSQPRSSGFWIVTVVAIAFTLGACDDSGGTISADEAICDLAGESTALFVNLGGASEAEIANAPSEARRVAQQIGALAPDAERDRLRDLAVQVGGTADTITDLGTMVASPGANALLAVDDYCIASGLT